MIRKLRRKLRARLGQRGQAATETGLLLATLFVMLATGGLALMKTQPDLMNAIGAEVRGYYFVLSLPIP